MSRLAITGAPTPANHTSDRLYHRNNLCLRQLGPILDVASTPKPALTRRYANVITHRQLAKQLKINSTRSIELEKW